MVYYNTIKRYPDGMLGVQMVFYYLFVFMFLVSGLFSQSMFLVEIKAENVKERSKIAKIAHIDYVMDDRVFSTVNQSDLNDLKKAIGEKLLSYELLGKQNSALDIPIEPFLYEFPRGDEEYHTYDEVLSEFKDLEKNFPDKAQFFLVGPSIENRDLFGIKLSQISSENEQKEKPAIVIMATHHAREHLSTEMPVLFADKFLHDSLTDLNIQKLLEETEIYIIPFVNPDGALYDIQTREYQMWRKNRKKNSNKSYGVDLNRNYSYGWGTGGSSKNPDSDVYMGSGPFSEAETKAMRDFFLAHKNITIALSFHSFSELILYPWGGKDTGIGGEDEKIFVQMAQDMAAMNHYRPMQSSDLYIASGDTCDWAYGELGVFCFTFELSPATMWAGGFYPGIGLIGKAFDDNYEPMLYLIEKAKNPKGVLNK